MLATIPLDHPTDTVRQTSIEYQYLRHREPEMYQVGAVE